VSEAHPARPWMQAIGQHPRLLQIGADGAGVGGFAGLAIWLPPRFQAETTGFGAMAAPIGGLCGQKGISSRSTFTRTGAPGPIGRRRVKINGRNRLTYCVGGPPSVWAAPPFGGVGIRQLQTSLRKWLHVPGTGSADLRIQPPPFARGRQNQKGADE
jgi:hypothetical protein